MRKYFRALVNIILWSCALVLLMLSMAGVVPQPSFYVDDIAQLRLPILIASIVFLPLPLLLRRKRVASLTAAIVIVTALPVFALCLPDAGPWRAANADVPHVRVLSANVWGARNLDTTRFEQLVALENPDLFVLIELTPAWVKTLKKHLPQYNIEFDEGISGGAAIFSKIPIQQIDMKAVRPYHRRFGARGIITVNNKQVLLIGSHPPAPSAIRRWQTRNAEMERLGADVRAERGVRPVVIAGDLNTTPWSYYFRHLTESGLHDSEQGLGPQPSWSTRMPLCLVPIDHALYTDGVTISNRHLGPNIGSDHLPLVFDLSVQ